MDATSQLWKGMSTHRRQTLSTSSERLPGGTDGNVRRESSCCCSYRQGGYVLPVTRRVLAEQACRVCQCSHRPQLKLRYANECLWEGTLHWLLILQSCEQTERRNDWAVKMWNNRLTDAAESAEWTTYDAASRQKSYALKDTNLTILIVKRPSAIVQKYCVVLQQRRNKQNAHQCLQWLCTDNNKNHM